MRYVKNTMSLAEKQAVEVAKMKSTILSTEQEKQEAKLDYIAMMADIDLTDIETEEESEEGMPYGGE